MRQRIVIEIDVPEGLQPYELAEKKRNGQSYEALKHFFEDIGYKVEILSTGIMHAETCGGIDPDGAHLGLPCDCGADELNKKK